MVKEGLEPSHPRISPIRCLSTQFGEKSLSWDFMQPMLAGTARLGPKRIRRHRQSSRRSERIGSTVQRRTATLVRMSSLWSTNSAHLVAWTPCAPLVGRTGGPPRLPAGATIRVSTRIDQQRVADGSIRVRPLDVHGEAGGGGIQLSAVPGGAGLLAEHARVICQGVAADRPVFGWKTRPTTSTWHAALTTRSGRSRPACSRPPAPVPADVPRIGGVPVRPRVVEFLAEHAAPSSGDPTTTRQAGTSTRPQVERIGEPEDDFESDNVSWVPLANVPSLIDHGDITSGTTLAALLYAHCWH